LRCGSVEEIEKSDYLPIFNGPDMGDPSGDSLAGRFDSGGIVPKDDHPVPLHNPVAEFRANIVLSGYESFEKLLGTALSPEVPGKWKLGRAVDYPIRIIADQVENLVQIAAQEGSVKGVNQSDILLFWHGFSLIDRSEPFRA
jgi:hypothetical protein